jgi:hypothetical protein
VESEEIDIPGKRGPRGFQNPSGMVNSYGNSSKFKFDDAVTRQCEVAARLPSYRERHASNRRTIRRSVHATDKHLFGKHS